MKCIKHPKYKAIYKPRADCKTCEEMYAAAKEIQVDMPDNGDMSLGEEQAMRGFGIL